MTQANTDLPGADTIVAAATPDGAGAVAVVRLSGPAAVAIGERLAGPMPAPRVAALRRFNDADGEPLDEGLVLRFEAPRSFTGEDVVELQGHGGPVVVTALVNAAVSCGARRAEPGEFSRRAFLNDRLDLAQAEAIADLVASGTSQAARAALRSMSGRFSDAVRELEAALTDLRVRVEAAIDFPDEGFDPLADTALTDRIAACDQRFDALLATARTGRLLADGLQVVIAGPPNAGKSSLLNRLSGEDSAIVTEIAGTTRDVLRERVDLDGLLVEFVDTAGLRDDPDRIEAEGIRRARRALEAADLALWITDGTAEVRDASPASLPATLARIHVVNKIDLTGEAAGQAGDTVRLSARTGHGLDSLKAAVKAAAGYRESAGGALSARQRHVEALERALRRFRAGVDALEQSAAGELLAEELRLAAAELGEITGRVSSDELLGRIFATFCIGK